MSTDWSKLKTYEDWADALRKILELAVQALQKNDVSTRGTVKRDLIEFIDESPNWLIRDLDDIGHETIKDLGKADINDAITSIESRTVDLIRLTKSVASVSTSARDAASSLRLENAKRVVESATGTIDAIKELKRSLEAGGTDKNIEKLANAAIKAVQDLRTAVEAL